MITDQILKELLGKHYTERGVSIGVAKRALRVAIAQRNAEENEEGWSQARYDAYDKEFGAFQMPNDVIYNVLGDHMLYKLMQKISEDLK